MLGSPSSGPEPALQRGLLVELRGQRLGTTSGNTVWSLGSICDTWDQGVREHLQVSRIKVPITWLGQRNWSSRHRF